MYQGVAALFVAQMAGVDLTFAQQLMIVLTAVLASIGTPGIPGAGIIMLIIVLEAVGLPPDGIAVILAVDRLMDMCRTVINVSGDGMTSILVAKSEGESITPPAPIADSA
jgi:Na+/H+-dicarboxylate symporter